MKLFYTKYIIEDTINGVKRVQTFTNEIQKRISMNTFKLNAEKLKLLL